MTAGHGVGDDHPTVDGVGPVGPTSTPTPTPTELAASTGGHAAADQHDADPHETAADRHETEADPHETEAPVGAMPTMWEQMGGPMGLVDSGLPVVVFVAVNAIGGLGWGIGAAVGAAAVIAILRLVRGKPVTQAVSGLLGVGVAAFIAYRTGSAKGYFLLGIWSYLLYGGALLLSIVVRWPLVGVLWEGLNGRGSAWRRDRGLVRKYDLATGVWVLVFALRFLVQNELYDSDQVGWLATARLLMGYPLFIAAIVATVLIVGSAAGMRLPAWMRRGRASAPNPEADRA